MSTQPSAASPWLVADIGGTNARIGLLSRADGTPEDVRVLPCSSHHDLTGLVRDYLDRTASGLVPAAACVAIAAPVTGDQCHLTNTDFAFSVEQTRHELALERLEVINDFEALARALPLLRPSDLSLVGLGLPRTDLPTAVVGPGTGLGVAGLIPAPHGLPIVVTSEGGHAGLAAVEDLEIELVRLALADEGAASAEMFISGPGLERIHRYLARLRSQRADALSAAEICRRAAIGADPLCAAALDTFCAMLGSVASSTALALGARGGVFLGGGILPRITGYLRSSRFRSRFESNARMSSYLAQIPTAVVTAAYPALTGAAALLLATSDVYRPPTLPTVAVETPV